DPIEVFFAGETHQLTPDRTTQIVDLLLCTYETAVESNLELRRTEEALEAQARELACSNESLAEERNLLRTLIDSLPDFIYIKDRESRFVLSNRAHLEVLGASSLAEVEGKTDFEIFPPELATGYYSDEQEIIRTGRPLHNREERVLYPSGEE